MEERKSSWKLSKYAILVNLYFFFNSCFLPKGLLYTNLLSPLFYFKLLQRKLKTYWLPFFAFLFIYDGIHLFYGVDKTSFILSNGLFISTYFCVISFYYFFNQYEHLSKIFKQIILINFVMSLIALPFLKMNIHYQAWFWWVSKLTQGVTDFPRLKLFTYEASYYSLLLIPIIYYYVLKAIFNQDFPNKKLTLFLVLFPFAISMSFGVIGATLITAIILGLVFRKNLINYKRPFNISLSILILLGLAFFILIHYFPLNPITIRFYNILNGTDTSTNGRIYDSFSMAWRIANSRNLLFGAGLGQIKIQAEEIVRQYYNYWGYLPRYDIPNTIGETLAIFGIVGVIIRLALQWFLFFKTKVFLNYYRLALFIFVFIYQFTGSYITNLVEYVIWILVFSDVFKQYNVASK